MKTKLMPNHQIEVGPRTEWGWRGGRGEACLHIELASIALSHIVYNQPYHLIIE